MNYLSILRDDVKREICNRCEFFETTTPDAIVCARTGEAVVAVVVKSFSQDGEVVSADPDEQVIIQLGDGVSVESTKADVIDGLLTTQERLANEADKCTSARSIAFLGGGIENFRPTTTYSRDELLASLSSDI